jgi:hypothetical protein
MEEGGMTADMDLTRLALEDRRRLAYYLEHNLINAISPLACCLDAPGDDARLPESARYAKSRILAVVNEVRELAGLRPVPERQFFPRRREEPSRQLPLLL